MLTKESIDTTTLLIGDTNSRVAPEDDSRLINILTGVIPMCLNEKSGAAKDIQMTDFPDGAFSRGKDGQIRQVLRQILDYTTGKVFREENSETELAEPKWPQFRMIMALGDPGVEKDKIEGKNIFEFQAQISRYFPSANVIVRRAAKDNNARGFGFQFPEKSCVCKAVKRKLEIKFQDEPSHFQQILNDEGRRDELFLMIFVSKKKILEFLAVLNPIIRAIKPVLDSIDRQILELEKNPDAKNILDKILSLQRLRDQILIFLAEKPLAEIISGWEKQTFKR